MMSSITSAHPGAASSCSETLQRQAAQVLERASLQDSKEPVYEFLCYPTPFYPLPAV